MKKPGIIDPASGQDEAVYIEMDITTAGMKSGKRPHTISACLQNADDEKIAKSMRGEVMVAWEY